MHEALAGHHLLAACPYRSLLLHLKTEFGFASTLSQPFEHVSGLCGEFEAPLSLRIIDGNGKEGDGGRFESSILF